MKTVSFLLALVALAAAQTVSPIDPNYTGCTDLNGDFVVDVADLALMLTQWGLSNCWNPAPATKTYYMQADRACAIAAGVSSTAAQQAVAVIRADRTQWSNVLSGSIAFLSGGPNTVTSISVRRVADNSLLLPLFGAAGGTGLTANPWGFSVYMTDAQYDELTANPSAFRLYFGTAGAVVDICAVFAEGTQPAPTTAPTTAAPPPGAPTAAPTFAAIPPQVDFTVTLNGQGVGICTPFSNPDSQTRSATAALTLTAVRTTGVLEGYALTGQITFAGSAPNWWQQIISIKLVRVPASPGLGPFVIASGPQSSNVINLQQLNLFISAGEDLVNNPSLYRLDVVTGTSAASGFVDAPEVCGPFVLVPPAPTVAPGQPTTAPAVTTAAAPTTFPFFEPVFLDVALDNVQCTPSGPFEDGAIAGAQRTATANLLLTRTKAANVITGSITFNSPATEAIQLWWNQVNRIEIRSRATQALLVTIFGAGGGAGITSNPFDSLSVSLSDNQLLELSQNTNNYYLQASSLGSPAGLVCGALTVSGTNTGGATTVPPLVAQPPFTFNLQLDGTCAGTTSLAVGTATLNVFPTEPLASIQGAISFLPANFPASIGFVGVYRASDDLLVQPLFSSGYNTLTSSFITINSQAEQSLVTALRTSPQLFRVQVNTQAFNTDKGEICGTFSASSTCVCAPCASTTAAATTTAGPVTTAAPVPTAAPTPFVAGDSDYTVALSGDCSGNPTFAQAASGVGAGSSATISLTYAPNPTTPTSITLSGSFSIQDAAYRALVTSVSIYRNEVVNGVSRRNLILNLWSGAPGTLTSTRLFTSVISTVFAYQFDEFSDQFFLGTSIEPNAVNPISICGQISVVVPPTVAPAPTAAPAPTVAITAAPTTVPPPTGVPTPPTPVPPTVTTTLSATVTCPDGGVSTFQMALLQLQSNNYQGALSGNANPLANPTKVQSVIIQRRSGVADQFTIINGPVTNTQVIFNSGGFLSTTFSNGLRQTPAAFDVIIVQNDGTTCVAPLAFA